MINVLSISDIKLLHQTATCLDCDKLWEGEKAFKRGYAHCKLKGHEVKFESIEKSIN